MNPLPRVLVVEDDEDDLFFAMRILRKAGFAGIAHVADGRQALEYLSGRGDFGDRSRFPVPDVLLIDLKIPGVTGHQLLEWIRQQPALAPLQAFVLSSSGEPRDRARANAAGAAGYFVKPLRPEDVAAILAARVARA